MEVYPKNKVIEGLMKIINDETEFSPQNILGEGVRVFNRKGEEVHTITPQELVFYGNIPTSEQARAIFNRHIDLIRQTPFKPKSFMDM